MKRDRFRLATVLRVRKIQEDTERGRLALAHADADRAAMHADRQTARYHDGAERSPASGTTNTFIGSRTHVERLVDAVVASLGDVVAAEVIVDDRRLDWSIAAQRVSALDRLRDRHREAFVAAALAEDVVDADERTITQRHRDLVSAPPVARRQLHHRPSSPAAPRAAQHPTTESS
jgi:flagellar protein FliJ